MGDLVAVVFFGLLGLQIGSFLNVYILRYPQNQSLGGRSKCLKCRKTLRWFELVPLVSFLVQKGRCRSCRTVLSLQYPLIESLTAALFIGSYFALHYSSFYNLQAASYKLAILFAVWTALSAALVITIIDIRHYLIPDGAVAAIFLSAIPLAAMRAAYFSDALYDLAAALVCALILGACWYLSRGRWMGFGDVKLILATSFFVGFPASILAFVFAFWTGALVGVALLLLKRTTLKSPLPFGPFILLGAALSLLVPHWFFGPIGL